MPMSVASESFLESTFIDQNNPKRQTAGPRRGSPKLDLKFLFSMPEIILKRVYGRRPRAMRPPSQRSTGAAHDDRDRAQLAPRSST